VHQPALGHEEADELLGDRDVAAVREDHSRKDKAHDRKGLPARAKGPLDGHRVLVIVLGPLALELVGDRERVVRRHDNRLGKELLVVVVGTPVY
jgi:hypothetical protein